MTAAPALELVQLRPPPHPPHPYGPYRVLPSGEIERFETDGAKVIKFFENYLVYPEDRWVGQPFKLLPWQKQLLIDMFELRYCAAHDHMARRYSTALVTVPKKQGKTALFAGLGLYFLVAEGEVSPRVFCAASSDDQADLVFGDATTMASQSDQLSGMLETWDKEIRDPSQPNAILRRVPANGGKLDGKRIFVALCDELHEWETPNQRKTFRMLRGGQATRQHPFFGIASTAGFNEDSLMFDHFAYGQKVESGEVEDDAFFFRNWSAPEGCDYRDIETYIPMANPSYGVTVDMDFYRRELNNPEMTENTFRRYYLNQWVGAAETWLPFGVYDAGAGVVEIPDGAEVTIGWDAAAKEDSTGVVMFAGRHDDDGQLHGWIQCWKWERELMADGTPRDPNWRLPIAEVERLLRDLHARYRVRGIGYDPAFITWSADELEAGGLPMEEVSQTPGQMVPATAATYSLFVSGRMHHDGDVALRRHINNSKPRLMRGGGEMLEKGARGVKNDLVMALLMAVRTWQRSEEELAEVPGVYIPRKAAAE